MCQNNNKKGFTLVELMIAIGFVGSLLIMIALVIVQIMGMYNKGLTLKSVNEVSRTVVRDMQQSIASADYFRVKYATGSGESRVTKEAKALGEAEESGATVDYYKNDAGGRLCTGVYSYAWNSGAAIQAYTDNSEELSYAGSPIQFVGDRENSGAPVRFVKTKDPSKMLCRAGLNDDSSVDDGSTTTRARYLGEVAKIDGFMPAGTPVTTDTFSNVLSSGNGNLVLYTFDILQVPETNVDDRTDAVNSVSTFYSLKLTVGTQNGDESEGGKSGFVSSNESCKPPSEATQNDGEYCAVNKIEFVARSGRIGE